MKVVLSSRLPYAISKVGTDLIGKYFYEAFGMKVLVTSDVHILDLDEVMFLQSLRLPNKLH